MRNGTARVGVEPGAGLVGRFGDAVILIAGDTGTDGGTVDELLDIVEAAASAAEHPGTVIAVRLAGWISGRMPTDDTAFGVVAPVANGVVVFLRGAVFGEVAHPNATRQLSGEQALSWVDQVVPLPFERVAIGSVADRSVRVHPRSALHSGVVPAQGFVLTPSGEGPSAAPADVQHPDTVAAAKMDPPEAQRRPSMPEPPAPADVPDARRPDEDTSSGGSGHPSESATREAEPEPPVAGSEPPVAEPEPPVAEPELREANRTDAGTAEPPDREQGVPVGETMLAPPPVGALVCDDGPTILLDRAYVLGREPHNDPTVQRAAASPIVLRDPDNLISRVHAYVSVDGGSVYVRDASSVSGTYIAAPGAPNWTQVGTEPTRILPDWSMRIGKWVFAFKATRTAQAL